MNCYTLAVSPTVLLSVTHADLAQMSNSDVIQVA